MLCVVTEDTERTIEERRLRTLRELAAQTTAEVMSVETRARLLLRFWNRIPMICHLLFSINLTPISG